MKSFSGTTGLVCPDYCGHMTRLPARTFSSNMVAVGPLTCEKQEASLSCHKIKEENPSKNQILKETVSLQWMRRLNLTTVSRNRNETVKFTSASFFILTYKISLTTWTTRIMWFEDNAASLKCGAAILHAFCHFCSRSVPLSHPQKHFSCVQCAFAAFFCFLFALCLTSQGHRRLRLWVVWLSQKVPHKREKDIF